MRSDNIIKEGRRRRYIGFNVSTDNDVIIEKNELIDVVRKQSAILLNKDFKEMGLFIVRFNGEQGIIRCKHLEKDNTIKLMRSIEKLVQKKSKLIQLQLQVLLNLWLPNI